MCPVSSLNTLWPARQVGGRRLALLASAWACHYARRHLPDFRPLHARFVRMTLRAGVGTNLHQQLFGSGQHKAPLRMLMQACMAQVPIRFARWDPIGRGMHAYFFAGFGSLWEITTTTPACTVTASWHAQSSTKQAPPAAVRTHALN